MQKKVLRDPGILDPHYFCMHIYSEGTWPTEALTNILAGFVKYWNDKPVRVRLSSIIW